ncbi:MAG: Holliday junction branch migration protein RuvA [Dehalococcoidia bacterium]|nr:Holliday junction branch migration protein RuvA [Dehalococcoidia bacterium]
MITGITGVLEARGADWVQVQVGGAVSLRVSCPSSTARDLGEVGQRVRLHTRLYARDDEMVLYGFSSADSLGLFQMLNGVSGIGPRMSLSLLSSLEPRELADAIAAGDVDALSRVPGVGKRSAGRLVLELRGKLPAMGAGRDGGAVPAGDDPDAVEALTALGYGGPEARRMVAALSDVAGLPLEERVRRALQGSAGA